MVQTPFSFDPIQKAFSEKVMARSPYEISTEDSCSFIYVVAILIACSCEIGFGRDNRKTVKANKAEAEKMAIS